MEQFAGNYTGPYWSDGKMQESVAFGEADAASELDALSRLHDTAYATYKDRHHREAADRVYYDESQKLAGMFPALAGHIVLYGNKMSNTVTNDVHHPFFPLAELVYNGAKALFGSSSKKDEALKEEARKDIARLYGEDPKFSCKAGSKTATPVEPKPKSNSNPSDAGKVESKNGAPGKTKTPTLPVESQEEKNQRLVQGQQRRFAKYNQVYVNSLGKSKKKKRKRMRGHGIGLALDKSIFTV